MMAMSPGVRAVCEKLMNDAIENASAQIAPTMLVFFLICYDVVKAGLINEKKGETKIAGV